jgi:hypothetical protein
MEDQCNCWECRLLRSGNIPDTIIAPDGTWGCQWCAGTGYEDYPTMDKPCRIEGHERMARQEQGLPLRSGHDPKKEAEWKINLTLGLV